MILQLHGDGGDTEKHDFSPGACATKVACVLTSTRPGGRGRGRITAPPLASNITHSLVC